MTNQMTEIKALEIAKSMLVSGFTIALMNKQEAENFIWGYLFDNKLQYKVPVEYIDDNGNTCSVIVYENK